MQIKPIESAHNPKLKAMQKIVRSASALKKQGVAVAEGLHLFESLFAHPNAPEIDSVWVSSKLLENPEFQQTANQLDFNTTLYSLPDHLYGKLSGLDHSPGPLVCFVPPTHTKALNLDQDIVLLDGIQDPGNVGTILRTCVATGVRQVVCTEGTAWVWGEKVLRAGMGAHRTLHFFDEALLLEALENQPTVPVRTTFLSPSSESLFNADLTTAGVWVFGSEGHGVGQAWLDRASQVLIIPQSAEIESLNVGISSAVCLYEQLRQRR